MSDHDQQQAPGAGDRSPDGADAERDTLRRNIALSLSTLVVLGAGLAVLQVDASARESNSARETTRTAVRAMRANVLANTVAGLEPALQSELGFLPFRRPLDTGAPTLAGAAELPPATAPSGDARVATQEVPDLGVRTLLDRLEVDAQRLTLKQRALATTRITWNDRSTQYTTVIAVLAVALFLVGFALVAEGPVRRVSYGIGVAVGLFATVWGVWIYLLPIPSTPDAAIAAAARGVALSAQGDYRTAVEQFDKALEADDALAIAHAGRSRARLLLANPDYSTARSVTDLRGDSIAAAVHDAARAHDLDPRNSLSVELLALTSFYQGDYRAAERASADAIAINPRVPDPWLLRSAAQVALGEQAAATASLERGLAPLRNAEPSQRTRLLSSTYLSYLARVGHDVPARADSARRQADRMVAIETRFTVGKAPRGAAPTRGSVAVQGLRYADDRLTVRLRWTNLPRGTELSAIAYERPLAEGAWSQPPDLALFATVAGSGTRDISVPLRRVCKPTEVRVDAYLNGARAVSRTGPGVRQTC